MAELCAPQSLPGNAARLARRLALDGCYVLALAHRCCCMHARGDTRSLAQPHTARAPHREPHGLTPEACPRRALGALRLEQAAALGREQLESGLTFLGGAPFAWCCSVSVRRCMLQGWRRAGVRRKVDMNNAEHWSPQA